VSTVLVITPTYNESESLPALADGILEHLPTASLLVVDDGSPDGTGAVAARLAAGDGRVHVLQRGGRLGFASAYLDGFRWGLAREFDVFVQMDADLSHAPADLPTLVGALDGGADLAIGSRRVSGGGIEGWSVGRHLLSWSGSFYSRAILGLAVRDLTSGYRAIRRPVLAALDFDEIVAEGYSFLIETAYRAHQLGFRVCEVPILFVDRRAGRSKMSVRIFLEAVRTVPFLRWRALRGRL